MGIDRRPQALAPGSLLPGPNNGRLYSIGINPGSRTTRVYTLDETTAAATLVSTLAPDPTDTTAPFPFTSYDGSIIGIDFDPTIDRLRLTNQVGQNLRIDVDSGLVQLDRPLSYIAGDLGVLTLEVGLAYSNNFANATSTVLSGVVVGGVADSLVLHLDPDAGLLQTTAVLPFFSLGNLGYDISGLTGTAYFAAQEGRMSPTGLYSSGPGGITRLGTIPAIRGLAAQVGPPGGPIPEPGTALVGVALCGVLGVCRWGWSRIDRGCD